MNHRILYRWAGGGLDIGEGLFPILTQRGRAFTVYKSWNLQIENLPRIDAHYIF